MSDKNPYLLPCPKCKSDDVNDDFSSFPHVDQLCSSCGFRGPRATSRSPIVGSKTLVHLIEKSRDAWNAIPRDVRTAQGDGYGY